MWHTYLRDKHMLLESYVVEPGTQRMLVPFPHAKIVEMLKNEQNHRDETHGQQEHCNDQVYVLPEYENYR